MEVGSHNKKRHDLDLSQHRAAFGREFERLRSLKKFKEPKRVAKIIMDTALQKGDITTEIYGRLSTEIDQGVDPEDVFISREIILEAYRGYRLEMEHRIDKIYSLSN